jgi:hypothetical protein
MNPQAVTVGARLGRRLNAKVIGPAVNGVNELDRVAFLGGLLASIAGGIAAGVGRDTAAELLRIALDRLQTDPQPDLPAGVRVAMDAVHAAAVGALFDDDRRPGSNPPPPKGPKPPAPANPPKLERDGGPDA